MGIDEFYNKINKVLKSKLDNLKKERFKQQFSKIEKTYKLLSNQKDDYSNSLIPPALEELNKPTGKIPKGEAPKLIPYGEAKENLDKSLIRLFDEKLKIEKSVSLKDKQGLKLLPSKTGRGRRWQRIETNNPLEKFDPHTLHLSKMTRDDIPLVLDVLKLDLQNKTGIKNGILDRSLKHYYNNFLVPVVVNKQLHKTGQINTKKYKDFLQKKQIEFELLTNELNDAIKKQDVEKYPTSGKVYRINKSRDRKIKALLLSFVKSLDEEEKKFKNKYGIKINAHNEGQVKEIEDALEISNLPEKHISKNIGLKNIIVEDDNNYLAKHSDNKDTIFFSNQVFSDKFKKEHPFHRIKHVPTLLELLVHEIGHSMEETLHTKNKKVIDPLWHDLTGWKYPHSLEEIKDLENKGYVSALQAFEEVPKEELTTLNAGDEDKIKERIKHRNPHQMPNKRMKISWYGVTSPREDFSESYVNYLLNNKKFKVKDLERYNYMKKYVFDGRIYDT